MPLRTSALQESQAGVEEGQIKQERALELAQRQGLEDYAGRAFIEHRPVCDGAAELRIADAYLERGLEYCRERGLDTWRLYLLGFRARLELDDASWDGAADTANAILRDPRSAPVPRGLALITLGLSGRAEATLKRPRPSPKNTRSPHRPKSHPYWLGRRGERRSGLARRGNRDRKRETEAALSLALRHRMPWLAGGWRAGGGARGYMIVSLRGRPRSRLRYRSRRVGAGGSALARWAVRTRRRWRSRTPIKRSRSARRTTSSRCWARVRRQRLWPASCVSEAPVESAWAAPADAGEPGRAHGAGARGAGPTDRGIAKHGDRKATGPLREDRRSSRLGDPAQARRPQSRRSGRAGGRLGLTGPR